jgi:hypothetical protein
VRLIIELPNYDEVFQEMLSYMADVSMDVIVESLIKDFNGLIEYCYRVYAELPLPEDTGMLNLVQYMLFSCQNTQRIDSMRDDCVRIYYKAIDNLLYQLTRDPNWINQYYQLVKYDTGCLAAFTRLKLVVETRQRYQLPVEHADKFYRLVRSTLDAVCRI